jgi:hypothetical protein
MRLTEEDFYQNNNRERGTELRIECIFSNFNNTEAGQFLEWISIKEGNNYELRIWLSATQKDNRIISNIRAGMTMKVLLLMVGKRFIESNLPKTFERC